MDEFRSIKGVRVPFMIYGTAWKKESTSELVKLALKSGFRGIDTACQPKHYREDLVGNAINDPSHGVLRKDIYIQTKFTPVEGHDNFNIPYDISKPIKNQVEESFEVSLKNLGTEYIDTFILHSPVFPLSKLIEAWQSMEKTVKKGMALQLGISNCYDFSVFEYLYNNVEIKPAILQNRLYQETGYDCELRNFCRNKGILYQSFWTLTANSHLLNSFVIRDLAAKYVKTEVQIFFRFLNQSGIIPLNGTTSKMHMEEDLSIFSFTIEDDDCDVIRDLMGILGADK